MTRPSDDVAGVVDAAVGKARLLATKKFKQFEGKFAKHLRWIL